VSRKSCAISVLIGIGSSKTIKVSAIGPVIHALSSRNCTSWALAADGRDQWRRPQAKHEGVNRSWVCVRHIDRDTLKDGLRHPCLRPTVFSPSAPFVCRTQQNGHSDVFPTRALCCTRPQHFADDLRWLGHHRHSARDRMGVMATVEGVQSRQHIAYISHQRGLTLILSVAGRSTRTGLRNDVSGRFIVHRPAISVCCGNWWR